MKLKSKTMPNNKKHLDEIYATVINLVKDHERRSYMEKQLVALDIPHVFLDATDGRQFDFSGVYNESISIVKHGRPLSFPEKGCALSHRRALEAFLTSGKKYGLIMEDDIAMDDSFPFSITKSIDERTKEPWTYLQFNYGPVGWQGIALWWFLLLHNGQKHTLPRFIMLLIKGIVANSISLMWGIRDAWHKRRGSSTVCPILRDQYLAGCYLVTREAAKALIILNTPLTYTADRIQNIARREGEIIHRVFVPRIVRQKREIFTSTINNDHFGKKIISY